MTDPVISNPLPSLPATTGAALLTTLITTALGWGASALGIPPALATAVIGGLVSVGTSLWHRLQGPRTITPAPTQA
jgi:hypothetical protein